MTIARGDTASRVGALPGLLMLAAMVAIDITVNGSPHRVEVRPGESLLDVLRNSCHTTSVKDGCQPQGQCGCCLAIVDGQAKTTCLVAAEGCDGKEIITVEGVPPDHKALLARAFTAAAGVQCGFCTPGFALRAWALVEKNPAPSREEIARAIDGHLCRCTGYTKILDAVTLYADARRGEPLPASQEDGGVGASADRYQAELLVLGQRPFVADLAREGLLHGALVFSSHPRARVLSIDPSAAQAMEGVVAVVTAPDVPGQRWYGVLYSDWPGFVAVGEEVRCVGDVLCAVAATDERTAREAAALVVVHYEPLPPILDPEESLRPGAAQVNPVHGNLLGFSAIRRGDVDEALREAAFVVSERFQTQRIEHLFLEPECALAEPRPGGGIRLFTQGQGIFDDRRQVAAWLGLPEEQVDVELVPNGGAFGGKEDMTVQPHAALLCYRTGRPVRVTLRREESVRMHPKRHPIRLDYTVACDSNGRLLAVRARMIGDSGAYASVGAKVLERAAGHATGPYVVPNVDIEARAAYTNNPPCGAMRGFGANQSAFALEGCLDRLAEQVGIDGWEIRSRNLLAHGDTFCTGQILEKGVGIRRTLDAVRPAWDAARAAGKAVGIACGVKNSGIGNGVVEWGRCRLQVEPDGTVALWNGFTEMGQGLMTVLRQIASEVSGVPASRFLPRVDSTFALGCGQTTGSRGTLLSGRAVIEAAHALRKDLDGGATLLDLAGRIYAGEVSITDTTPLGAPVARPKTHTAYGWATQVVILAEDGRIERVVAAHDTGRTVNPALCAGQVEGAVVMGLGYALTEELPTLNGMPVTSRLREIGALRARDVPEIEVILVEEPEPEGPFGAKGVGEIGLVPTAGAVAGALHAHDGQWRTTLPMKDSAAARAIKVGRIPGERRLWR